MGTPRACSGYHPSTSSNPTAKGTLDPATSCPFPRWQRAGGQPDPSQPLFCRWINFVPGPGTFLAQSGTDAALGTLQRPPWGWRGLSIGRQKPHGAAGVAKPARASRRCSAIQHRSRQGHSPGHVPVPWVTRPQGGQSCPEPRQCIFPPSDARRTIPSHGHNPGTPLTPAHIWPRHTFGPGTHLAPAHISPRHTSGERSAPSPSCPVSPPPAPGRAARMGSLCRG